MGVIGAIGAENLKHGSACVRYETRPVFLLGSSDELRADLRSYLLFSASLSRNYDPDAHEVAMLSLGISSDLRSTRFHDAMM